MTSPGFRGAAAAFPGTASLGSGLAAAVAALVTGALVIGAAGGDPAAALLALAGGALGDRHALTDTLLKTCPLLLTGLAVALAFRTGSWNIGADGQLLVGALAATAASGASAALPFPLPLVLAVVAGTTAGAVWAGVAAALRALRGVSEVIGTIMLNFIAVRLVGWAVHGPLMEAGAHYPQSDPIPPGALLPMLAGRLHGGLVLAALATVLVWLLLFRTGLGFRWRACGDNPDAACVAGFRPGRALVGAMLVSGALAGLAGAIEVLGVTGRLFEQFSGGQGYTAIAVALLGRLHPMGIVVSAFFFGALAAGSGAMQRVAGVSAVVVAIVQAITVFAVLALDSPRRVARGGRPAPRPSAGSGRDGIAAAAGGSR